MLEGFIAGSPPQNARLDALCLKRDSDPIGVVAAVYRQHLHPELLVEQRCTANIVADLGRRHDEARQAAVRIGDTENLRVHAAFRASNQAVKTPLCRVGSMPIGVP